MAVSDKIMFEIYREAEYGRKYRVVYFTELDEHNKEAEISRALAGEHLYDGFISALQAAPAKRTIGELLTRLNDGDAVAPDQIADALTPFAAS